jgi:hypothetical protein
MTRGDVQARLDRRDPRDRFEDGRAANMTIHVMFSIHASTGGAVSSAPRWRTP